MFDALQDVKLIKILLFGIVLLALSVYYPSGEAFDSEPKPSKFRIKIKKKEQGYFF
jgi:hypothetical protein